MTSTHIRNQFLAALAYFVIAVGVGLSVYVFLFFRNHNIILTPDSETPDFTITGPIGDFVGGIIGTVLSFAATLLVIVTLFEQNRHNSREHFAQNYFEMLKIHNDNVNNMLLHQNGKDDVRGRAVFTVLIGQYEKVYDHVHSCIMNIVNGGMLGTENEKEIVDYLNNRDNMLNLEMRLAYGFYFFGSEVYRLRKPLRPLEIQIEERVHELMKYQQTVVYGHNVLLGHYYRHIYQMVMLMIKENSITEDERYSYAKQLRAQLNDDEQILLYYNAMSELGEEWLVLPSSVFPYDKVKQMSPMARFRMIKNIRPEGTTKGIQPKDRFSKEIKIYKEKKLDFFELQ